MSDSEREHEYRCVCGWRGQRHEMAMHPRQGFGVCPPCWRRGTERIPDRWEIVRGGAPTITVDGLTYGEHMIRAIRMSRDEFADGLASVVTDRDRLATELSSTQHRLREREEEAERLRASHALRDEGYAQADYQAVAENIAHDPRWALRADSQRVARWALSLQQQLVACRKGAADMVARVQEESKRKSDQLATITRERDEAVRSYDLLGEELEQIIGGDGTSLERLRRLERERMDWQRIAEERLQVVESTCKERDTALQSLSSAAEKGVAAGELVGEVELEAMTKARDEACDLFFTTPEQIAAGFDPAARIAELRRVGGGK